MGHTTWHTSGIYEMKGGLMTLPRLSDNSLSHVKGVLHGQGSGTLTRNPSISLLDLQGHGGVAGVSSGADFPGDPKGLCGTGGVV